MQNWFGFNPLDVILGTVGFSTVALAVFEIWPVIRSYFAQKPSGEDK